VQAIVTPRQIRISRIRNIPKKVFDDFRVDRIIY
jgi:hypothetical protein